ncbi:MAG TPA: PAS domain-containing protein, partial [Chondromyces sp.]|nr:PAS domain-containing protein [Chondromyces sp.]
MDLIEHSSILLKHILQHSFDEIFITDASGNILYTSQSTEKMFGIPLERIIHQNIFHLEKEGVFSPSVVVNVLRS